MKQNVFPHLTRLDVPFLTGELRNRQLREYPYKELVVESWASRETIKKRVEHFCRIHHGSGKPEFWGYYADYDWVVLCQLFGKMVDLPADWPKYCLDIKQFAMLVGNPELPKQEGTAHNALVDARWHKQMFDWLIQQHPQYPYHSKVGT